MFQEPVTNDPHNPLISILVYTYETSSLRACFESIFGQTALGNIEIIFIDDTLCDEAWNVALEYSRKYPRIFSLTRNNCVRGLKYNKKNGLRMAKGKYYVTLHTDLPFSPEYIKQCIQIIEQDEFAKFKTVGQTNNNFHHLPTIKSTPLVSMCIFNYNYGRYLRQCLESVFAQSYSNIEVCFSDNASSDESWEIALEFAGRYPGKMSLTRNRKNFGSDMNLANCWAQVRGKYFVELCSDDALAPGFVEKCVSALESSPESGYVMVHRAIIDEHGNRSDEPPFYNQSCVIPGPEQAAVYMMAAVNPCISQIMYNTQKVYGKSGVGGIASRWYGTRINDFNMCCEFSMAYIKEPLLLHRLHSQNDSFRASENMLEIIGPYVLQHQYADIAGHDTRLSKVVERLKPSIDKLASLCLRYSVRSLVSDERMALRYFHLAAAVNPDICQDAVFRELEGYWSRSEAEKAALAASLQARENLTTRSVSYDPPPMSVPLESLTRIGNS